VVWGVHALVEGKRSRQMMQLLWWLGLESQSRTNLSQPLLYAPACRAPYLPECPHHAPTAPTGHPAASWSAPTPARCEGRWWQKRFEDYTRGGFAQIVANKAAKTMTPPAHTPPAQTAASPPCPCSTAGLPAALTALLLTGLRLQTRRRCRPCTLRS